MAAVLHQTELKRVLGNYPWADSLVYLSCQPSEQWTANDFFHSVGELSEARPRTAT